MGSYTAWAGSVSASGGGTAWDHATLTLGTPDASVAEVSLFEASAQTLKWQGFDFSSIPEGATLTGCLVSIKARYVTTGPSDGEVWLDIDGTTSDVAGSGSWPSSLDFMEFGEGGFGLNIEGLTIADFMDEEFAVNGRWERFDEGIATANLEIDAVAVSLSYSSLEENCLYWTNCEASPPIDKGSLEIGMSNSGSTVTNSTGLIGNCIEFPGSGSFENSGGGNPDGLSTTSAQSISLWYWVPYSAFVSGEDYGLIGFYDGSSNNIWQMRIYNDGIPRLGIDFGDFTLSSSVTVSPENWQHVVLTFSGSTVSVYFNGSSVEVLGAKSISSFSSTRLRLGVAATRTELVGKMDLIGIWDRELTETDVLALYNSGAGYEVFSDAEPPIEITGTGGALCGGAGTIAVTMPASGGTVCGGEGLIKITIPASGGNAIGGAGLITIARTGSGGARMGGTYTPLLGPVITATGGMGLGGVGIHLQGEPFGNGFHYRKAMTIPASRVSSNLTGFPLAVRGQVPFGHTAGPDDFRFEDADENPLDSEVFLYVHNSGEFAAYVKTNLSHTLPTEINIYYGEGA